MTAKIVSSKLALYPEIPDLSLEAWEKLLARLPELQPDDQRQAFLSSGAFAIWQSLRLAGLPGWEKIVALEDDAWVFQYEQLQEKLAKKRRKAGETQTGVFYTPPAIAKYLVERTLSRHLNQIADKIQEALCRDDILTAKAEWQLMQELQVIDPACGTGIFLAEALQVFHQFYRRMAQANAAFALDSPAHHAMVQHLGGIDIDPLSVMITEFRLAQIAARLDGLAVTLNRNASSFFVGDTLQSGAAWNLNQCIDGELSHQKRWHFILGNPPYITEVRKQAQRFRQLQDTSSAYYQAKMDLCDGFLAWGIDHLHSDGQLAYILPAYWTQRSSTAPVREFLWREGHLQEVWNFEAGSLFKNAPGHHSALMIWRRASQPTDSVPKMDKTICDTPRAVLFGHGASEADLHISNLKPHVAKLEIGNGKILLGDAVELDLLSKLSVLPPLLSQREIQQGLVIPQGRVKVSEQEGSPLFLSPEQSGDVGVFVLNTRECVALDLTEAEKVILRPFYRPAGFSAFQGFEQSTSVEKIIYTDLKNRRALAQHPEQYARLRAHLDQFASINTSSSAPYGLHRARQADWFEADDKIFASRQVFAPAFALVPFSAYVNEGFLVVRSAKNPHWLCALLNSNLAWFWFYHQKRKGCRLQIDKEVLCRFPEPQNLSPEVQAECISLAQKLAALKVSSSLRDKWQNQLNHWINQAYQLTTAEIAAVEKLLDQLKNKMLR